MIASPNKMLLSVITVCRNEATRIQRTLDSVIRQSDQEFEWIIVDGASSDGTLACLEPHRNRITRLISEPDKGIYDAMNKGLRLAQGTYVLFLNAGDWLADDRVLEDFTGLCPREELVIGDILIRYPDDREQYRSSALCGADRDYLYWRSPPHQATFTRRTLFDLWGGFDTRFPVAADWEFFARTILNHNATVLKWPRCVSVFTNDGFSASPANTQLRNQDRQRIRQRYFPLHYRLRRGLNENWGMLVDRFRKHMTPPVK